MRKVTESKAYWKDLCWFYTVLNFFPTTAQEKGGKSRQKLIKLCQATS